MTEAGQIMQNVFELLLNEHIYNLIISKNIPALLSFFEHHLVVEDNLIVWEKNKEAYL